MKRGPPSDVMHVYFTSWEKPLVHQSEIYLHTFEGSILTNEKLKVGVTLDKVTFEQISASMELSISKFV